MSHLFIPGPVDVHEEVLAAMTRPMLPHRSAEFEEIFRRTELKARKIFQTKSRVFLLASSGTGFHEAAVRNLVNKRMLACVNGAFSQRWYQVAQSNGKQVDLLDVDWRSPITPQLVADALQKHKYEMLTIVHNETSTGMLNPVAEIAAAVHISSPDTLICVDAVSSLGGAKIETDVWGLDMVLTSSQKTLALPPGLALAAVSDRALEKAKTVENRGWYFDLLRLEKHRLKDSSPATPAMSLIYALDRQLDRILSEGMENRFNRHAAMAKRVQEWAGSQGLSIYAPEGFRSQTVTTIKNERDIDISELNAFLKARGMRLANGYGPLKNITFRIAHMGETQMQDLEELFASMEEYLS